MPFFQRDVVIATECTTERDSVYFLIEAHTWYDARALARVIVPAEPDSGWNGLTMVDPEISPIRLGAPVWRKGEQGPELFYFGVDPVQKEKRRHKKNA